MRVKTAIGVVAALAGLAFAQPARANSITFSGSVVNGASTRTLSASAVFDVVGGNLQVVLTNTGLTSALSPSDLLSAVFFDVAGSPALTYVSGTAQSLVNDDGTANAASTSVGTQWQLISAASSALPFGGVTQNYGFGGAGFGIFGAGVDGADYNIVTAAFNGGGNLNSNKNPYIKNSITLVASGIPVGFNPFASVSNVRFQWGTALDEPSTGGGGGSGGGGQTAPVPEPASMLLLGTGLLGMGAIRRRFGTTKN